MISFIKRYWVVIFYLALTSALFYWLETNIQTKLRYDDWMYDSLANKLISNNFNLLTTDFAFRTFFFPLYLAIVKVVTGMFFPFLGLKIYFFLNLILFHAANFFVFQTIKKYSKQAASIFLFLSSFNLITLSYTVLVLTEGLSIFFVSLIFFLISKDRPSILTAMGLGLSSALYVFTRPAALLLFLVVGVVFLINALKLKAFRAGLSYLVTCAFIFLIGILNVYFVTGQLGVFPKPASNIYTWHLKNGNGVIKYETSIDPRAGGAAMYYIVPDRGGWLGVITLRLFTVFDRVYIDTYVRHVANPDTVLRLVNYFVLSGAILYAIFFSRKKEKNGMKVLGLIIGSSMVIYLPVIPEPRFSAPVFPLILATCSFYLVYFLKSEARQRVKLLFLQTALIALFYACSTYTLTFLSVRPGY